MKSTDITKAYLGSTEAKKIYLGSTLVYGGSDGGGSYDDFGYILDGKVFHLDGIDKGNTSGAWTDLVNGYVFTNSGGASSTSNGWYFNGSAANSILVNSDGLLLPANEDYTVEICLVSTQTTYSAFILKYVTNVPLFYVSGSKATFLQNGNTYTFKSGVGTHCYSYNLTSGCEDGVAVSPNSSTDFWNNNGSNFVIGARHNGSGARFKGTIHSIRVYERRLSYDEMRHNQQVDNTRFNLGLSI